MKKERILRELTEKIGDSPTAFRRHLRNYPPQQVLSILLSPSTPAEIGTVLPEDRTRFGLLRWIYGESYLPLLKSLAYLRFPSGSKLALTHQIRRRVKRRFPWLTSRILHAIAFRPDWFDSASTAASGVKGYGPLYRKVEIPKGRGRLRTLHCPNRPLKCVQRAILRTVLAPLAARLGPMVCGCRESGSIFSNAKQHLGQKFVASFDLRNFFPSVRVGHLITALTGAEFRVTEQDVARVGPDYGAPAPQQFVRTVYNLEHDSAVLLARLLTHKSRLPQGAPSSPAAANLAFARFDQELEQRLGEAFVYTRYVDDVTISVSEAGARQERITSAAELERRAEQVLQSTLEGTGFALNPRKTCYSERNHVITGLSVRGWRIDIPRTLKRLLRNLLHRLRTQSFVDAACRHVPAESLKQIREDAKRLRHWMGRRRLSIECLAALTLRQICPHLSVTITDASEVEARMAGENARAVQEFPVTRSPEKKWRYIERLLFYLWNGSLHPTVSGNAVTINDRGRTIELKGSECLGFFTLSRREAACCTEFWHYIRGLASYLSVKDQDPCFDPIRNWGKQLQDALERVAFPTVARTPDLPAAAREPIEAAQLEPADDVRRGLCALYGLLTEFRRRADCPDRMDSAEHVRVFKRTVSCREELKQWMVSAAHLFVAGMPVHPMRGDTDKGADIFDAVRIVDDALAKRRGWEYETIKQVGSWIRATKPTRLPGTSKEEELTGDPLATRDKPKTCGWPRQLKRPSVLRRRTRRRRPRLVVSHCR